MSSPVVTLLLHIVFYTIGKAIDCESFRSEASATDPGATIEVGCPAGYKTMVSCGFEVDEYTGINAQYYGGSWIDDTNDTNITQIKCVAINRSNKTGIYAHARCCDFSQDVECMTKLAICNTSSLSIANCASDEYMLGCSASNSDDYFGGLYPGSQYPVSQNNSGKSYPMTNQCNAIRGAEYGVQSQVNCCTASIGLECNVYYQYPGQPTNWLSCPNGQTMIDCMGVNNKDVRNAKYVILLEFYLICY